MRWTDEHDGQLLIDSAIEITKHGGGAPELHEAATKPANVRTVTLDVDTVEMIDKLRRARQPYGPWMCGLCPELVSLDRISWWWKRARQMSGIDPKWRLHDLRHWSATVAKRVADLLTEWVAAKIDEVPPPHQPGLNGLVWGEHPDVPFRWALWQALPFDAAGLIGPNARVVQISFAKPADLEELRVARLRRALDEKVPKLLEAAGNSCRSILVIENRDTAFSAPAFVSRALEMASNGRPLPDVIYLLDTGRGNAHMLAVYDAGVWAHASEAWYDWKGFSIARSSELNVKPTNWA